MGEIVGIVCLCLVWSVGVAVDVVSDFNGLSGVRLWDHVEFGENVEFQEWINWEVDVANDRILRNIKEEWLDHQENFDDGGVPSGVIIASPSRREPDYYYQWTRDSAITVLNLISNGLVVNTTLYDSIINDYLTNQFYLQRVDNLSGKFTPWDKWNGLGEPKFYINNTAFNKQWGRPQSDGPALRLIVILTYLKGNNNNNKNKYMKEICRFDMEYIIYHWDKFSFDPWEEINSNHFFNSMVQLYALKLYQNITKDLPLMETIVSLEEYIVSTFIDNTHNFIKETPQLYKERPSGLDIAVILACLITHPIDNQVVQMPFDIDNLLVLNTLYKLIEEMRSLYPINKIYQKHAAIALGRYPEDIYDGVATSEGNPWFLSTCQGATLLYRLVHSLTNQKQDLLIQLDGDYPNFWSLFFEKKKSYSHLDQSMIIIPYHSLAFNDTMKQIINLADGFIHIIKTHVNENGDMNEQFNKYTGFLTGATNLTWSYVEFINAINARKIVLQYS